MLTKEDLIQELRKAQLYSYFPYGHRRNLWCGNESLGEILPFLEEPDRDSYSSVREEIRAVVEDIDSLMEEYGWTHERYRAEVNSGEKPRENIEKNLFLPIYVRLRPKHDFFGILEWVKDDLFPYGQNQPK